MPEQHDFWHEDLPQPACGVPKEHMFHSHRWMDEHFKVHSTWCNGICLCNCSCPDHKNQPHGPGAHK